MLDTSTAASSVRETVISKSALRSAETLLSRGDDTQELTRFIFKCRCKEQNQQTIFNFEQIITRTKQNIFLKGLHKQNLTIRYQY
ncbi:hypothetical protein PoB_005837500 [Plakobranchus ocellatus]|uniref:Uncharacterized protein n=1 Tax=Plakobranchus ocellatus TaxID=259542 RepID=A0AAV4CGB1_9GAST|nr:hypothetical protein PoB_005837500 [Plakobranchus ocellatus]